MKTKTKRFNLSGKVVGGQVTIRATVRNGKLNLRCPCCDAQLLFKDKDHYYCSAVTDYTVRVRADWKDQVNDKNKKVGVGGYYYYEFPLKVVMQGEH